MYFVSYVERGVTPFVWGLRPSQSGWVPKNAVLEQHPLVWLAGRDRSSVRILFWERVPDELLDPPLRERVGGLLDELA